MPSMRTFQFLRPPDTRQGMEQDPAYDPAFRYLLYVASMIGSLYRNTTSYALRDVTPSTRIDSQVPVDSTS